MSVLYRREALRLRGVRDFSPRSTATECCGFGDIYPNSAAIFT